MAEQTYLMSFAPADPSATSVEIHSIGPRHLMRRMRPHGHLFFEVLLFTEGKGTVVMGGREIPVRARTVLAIAPGVQHDCRRMASADGWSIIFLPDGVNESAPTSFTVEERLPSTITFDLFRLPAITSSKPIALDEVEFDWALALIERMRSELHSRHTGYEIVVRSALQMLLVGVGRHVVSAQQVEASSLNLESRDFVNEILADIDANFGVEGSLRAAAKRLNLQAGHLTTKLRRLTGRTYSSWLTERRMAEARRLLAATTLPLAVIAEQLGYTEVESFVRRFRRHHAMTPGLWRNRTRGSSSNASRNDES